MLDGRVRLGCRLRMVCSGILCTQGLLCTMEWNRYDGPKTGLMHSDAHDVSQRFTTFHNWIRCSGMFLRKTLFTATAPDGEGVLFVAMKRNGVTSQLPVVQWWSLNTNCYHCLLKSHQQTCFAKVTLLTALLSQCSSSTSYRTRPQHLASVLWGLARLGA